MLSQVDRRSFDILRTTHGSETPTLSRDWISTCFIQWEYFHYVQLFMVLVPQFHVSKGVKITGLDFAETRLSEPYLCFAYWLPVCFSTLLFLSICLELFHVVILWPLSLGLRISACRDILKYIMSTGPRHERGHGIRVSQLNPESVVITKSWEDQDFVPHHTVSSSVTGVKRGTKQKRKCRREESQPTSLDVLDDLMAYGVR